jgi:hypothetical protein
MPLDSYDRKISSEESRDCYVLVEKSRLAFFPPVDQQFQLKYGGKQRAAAVEAWRLRLPRAGEAPRTLLHQDRRPSQGLDLADHAGQRGLPARTGLTPPKGQFTQLRPWGSLG